jgi:protein gp37
VSEGCRNCYAERIAARNLPGMASPTTGQPFAIMRDGEPHWTGRVELIESKLTEPLHWRKPCRVFVNSMSDLFHEALPDEAIDRVFAVMALTPHINYQVLTKRVKRMRKWASVDCDGLVDMLDPDGGTVTSLWPLPNVWLGVSVEDQRNKDRIDHLRQTPAAIRFLSLEPLLEDLGTLNLDGIYWVIVGGESGPGARPMHPDWVRSIRDQCVAAVVPFFFKQFGEWAPCDNVGAIKLHAACRMVSSAGLDVTHDMSQWKSAQVMKRAGKKAAGRLLDGREWNELPR